ncbi:ABC transporter ATP-binding protein [Chryseobacterium bernardetii]|uniref:ABC transporter ATP-binding protein n=1 Tax=Chryseobacterium bernardetii TaxID=1241978 RepID=UPI000F4FF6F7|nr:ABC transporter ATP-binding protein [Chryseobacterium bernardetii]AZB35472.1 ABC transporter ATP-binding protein [Chryseobacterium bernardetii]
MTTNIELDNISYKIKDKKILNNISFKLSHGLHILIGSNGAGKTTLIKLLSTLTSSTSGIYQYNQVSVKKNRQIKKEIGFMPQQPNLYLDLTVYQNIMYFGLLKGGKKKEIEAKIDLFLESFSILQFKNIKVQNLSGGIQQRVSIIISIINNPKLLILDEPTNNLDEIERDKLYQLLKKLSVDAIVIFSTHLIDEAVRYCDKIIVMKDGNISLNESISNIKNSDIKKYF